MRVLAPLMIVVCLFVIAPAASRQTVSVEGTVVDSLGAAVPGVALELRRGVNVEQRTVSDQSGAWAFTRVAPGAYEIRATLAGFNTSVVAISVGNVNLTQVRVPMQVGALSETVTTGSQAPGVSARAGVAGAPPASQTVTSVDALMANTRHLPALTETATYAAIDENGFRAVAKHPLSTFSVDVDTASYANVRRFLNDGRLPPADAVRIEEMINYFKYDYPAPRGNTPVAVTTEVAACPWNPGNRLALIGLRATPIRDERTPPRNLAFLLDVSGSMQPQNRLPLVKAAMKMLVDTLRAEDRVSIVVYAAASGVVLEPTAGDQKQTIHAAIDRLQAGGSTNGGSGIHLAYDLVAETFDRNQINRVILATDGDFNVGITSRADLTKLIEERRERGIFLSVLGVGDNNLQDATMEMLADKGNGNYSYLDSIQEARRVLIAEAGSTLVTVAKDVKLQIEFNPRFVAAYRLVGYENRVMRKEDFNNDRKDAGEMGAGHTVTALYEIVPAGQPVPGGAVDPLKYQPPDPPPAAVAASNSKELMNIKVRYKEPLGDASRLLEFPVADTTTRMTANLGFAAAVAEFGMLLRKSDHKGAATWDQMLGLAREHRGSDPDGYRAELIRLADVAKALDVRGRTSTGEGSR